MGDGIVGQFKYASLASPVTLLPGTAYYVMSEENFGGDNWYDFNTTVTTTSIATTRFRTTRRNTDYGCGGSTVPRGVRVADGAASGLARRST